MISLPAELWPWLALAGLGLYHGINPAMGWLFATALGLHRRSQRVVLLSLVPIALGHAISVAATLAMFLTLGHIIDAALVARLAGVALIGWSLWHFFYGHRQQPIVGMQTGLLGPLLWSFLMASAHGAGLMLLPVLLPICVGATPGAGLGAPGPLPLAIAALGVHTAAMLAVIALISVVVYNWIGVDFLRRGWINFDRLWSGALFVCGIALLA